MTDNNSTALRGVTADAGTTKARIERAALALFCKRGVDAVTTREIAAASKLSEGALYRHYPSKESIGETMFFAIHHRLADEIRAAAEACDTLEKKARAVVSTYCRIADEDWMLFCYHLLTTHRFLPYTDKASPERSTTANPVRVVEEIITKAMTASEISAGDTALKAAAALGVVLQTALHKAYGRVNGPLADHEDQLSRAVIAVLKS